MGSDTVHISDAFTTIHDIHQPGQLATGSCRNCDCQMSEVLTGDPLLDTFIKQVIGSVICDDCAAEIQRREQYKAARDFWWRRVREARVPESRAIWNREAPGANVRLYDWITENMEESLFICDDYSTNKTWCLCSIAAKEAQIRSVQYWNVSDLLSHYAALSGESQRAADQFKLTTAKSSLIVLDDIGKRKITESAGDVLYSLINKAYENGARIWISANMHGQAIRDRFQCRDTGAAVHSRLTRMCKVWAGGGPIE